MIYEFITIERTDGPFELPGEIVEILEDSPHSKQKFTALVRLDNSDEDVVEEDEDSWLVPYEEMEGVGATVATRLKASGYRRNTDLQDVDPKDLADEIKGLGPGRAEKIIENIQ